MVVKDVTLELRGFEKVAMQFEGRHDGMWEIAMESEEAAMVSEEVMLDAGCEEGLMGIEEGKMEILGSHQVHLP